jgi:acetyl-CoA synthetase
VGDVDRDLTADSGSTWERAADWMDGLPGGGLNIAHEAVIRHATGPRAGHVALRFLRRDDTVEELTYAELAEQVLRFADVLGRLGIARGERVFLLSGRTPAAYVAALGTLAHGAVLCPLFSAFGPEPLHQRLSRGDGVVLVTTAAMYHKKVAGLRDRLPALRHVLLVDAAPDEIADPGVHSLPALLAEAAGDLTVAATDAEDMALLHFTSGTTGMPKGAVHVHRAVIVHHATARLALGLGPDDVYWCTADPGWVTGTSYGIIAPLTHGCTAVVDEADFDARRWYGILEQQRVTVWYTAPTAIRMLMKAGDDLPGEFDLGGLRVIASVGEPLNAEAVLWSERVLGLPIRDNWWQSETGAIMIANRPDDEVRAGSMGRPMPGMDIDLVRVDDEHRPVFGTDGTPELVEAPDTDGMLAIRAGWPSMFRDYLHDHERYERCFAGDWYLSGDLARRDADGWYWFVGRADDVIKTAGHLIGPFEVESVLMEHPAVVEAAVIGVPDPVAGNVVKAFVTLRDGAEDSEDLRLDLLGFARRRLGPAVAPRSIVVSAQLPHTRSGKIMRRLLRARELGLPEGDLSTLEDQVHAAAPAPQEPTT